MTRQRIAVVLADDSPRFREGMAALLEDERDIDVIGLAGDGVEVVEMTRQARPDVVVMDVYMPRLNGIEATRQIMAEMPHVRVIGLSVLDGQETVAAMARAGAAQFLDKSGCSETLVGAIRRR